MEAVYYIGNEDNTEEILDFANMVFSMQYGGVNFAEFFPKAYSESRAHILTHHMIKEGERIRALVDVYPFMLKINNCGGGTHQKLNAAYIGTVAVHPNSRGKGYMTKLMKAAEDDAVKKGFDIMILDGIRHRYRNYGFEKAGIKYNFNIRFENVMHCCDGLYAPQYSFEEIDEESEYLDSMYNLYNRRNVTARAKEDFFLCLQSSGASVFAVLKDGKPAGYINMSHDEKNILEFEINDIFRLPKIMYDLMDALELSEIGITVGSDETEKIEYLEKTCDYFNLAMSHQIKILNYKNVFEFMFRWKIKYDTIAINKCVIEIRHEHNKKSERVKISYDGINAEAEYTDEKADVSLEDKELVSLFTTGFYFAECQKGRKNKVKNIPQGWLPLPFFLPDADAF